MAMEKWFDFAEIKQAAGLLDVLKRYRVGELRRSGRNQWRGRCPLHGGQGQDSFHVNDARQLFHCFACGAGGTVLDFVAAMEQCSVAEAARRLAAWWAVAGRERKAVPATATITKKREANQPLRFRLRELDSRHPYLRERGITEQTAQRFGLGFYEGPGLLHNRLVIPLHDEWGQLVAYCGRSLDGADPRYKFPAGFAKSQMLFNWHRAVTEGQQSVIVVEGFFDCLKVHQAGFGSVVALMGVVLYERPRLLLRQRFSQVILMLDGDTVGRRAGERIVEQLRASCDVVVIGLAHNWQPDQLTAQAIGGLLGNVQERSVPRTGGEQ